MSDILSKYSIVGFDFEFTNFVDFEPISLGMDARLIQRHNKQLLTNVIDDLILKQ